MTLSADEQWIADARERHARSGNWERDAEAIFEALNAQSEKRTANEPPLAG